MISYSISDGVQTLTEANSLFLAEAFSSSGGSTVTTDASGNPLEWSFFLYLSPLSDMVGEPASAIQFLYSGGPIFEAAFRGLPCDFVSNGACGFSQVGTLGQVGDSASTGLFTLGAPPPPWTVVDYRSIPTLSELSLVLLVSVLGLVGVFMLRGRMGQYPA